jgi:threonylcarbamoyladenosine tRNA methylthiotransferase MtaB
MQTVKFYTLGCKVNQYETQSIRESFIESGFKELENSKPAKYYVINTCTVTHKADVESLKFIRKAKRENPRARIIVTGCLAELDEGKIKNIDHRASIIKKAKFLNDNNEINGISHFKGHTRAFLKIQDGCNNYCSYCKVPLVRGPSKSRPLNEIIAEADRLAKNGFKEIVLTGICLGAYGRDLKSKPELLDVITALEKIEELLRIRLSSIEAGDISDRLINKMKESKKLCRHLHIPLQSGDDGILKKMNRRYTFADYLHLICKIKAKIPDIAVTTDVLVGFPGETEENFQNTVKLIKEIIPLKVHIFPYSSRDKTEASNFREKLQPNIMKARLLRLKNISQDCSVIYKRQFLNKKMDVLVEGRTRENKEWWEGYTQNYIKVRVETRLILKNKLIPLCLKRVMNDSVIADFH